MSDLPRPPLTLVPIRPELLEARSSRVFLPPKPRCARCKREVEQMLWSYHPSDLTKVQIHFRCHGEGLGLAISAEFAHEIFAGRGLLGIPNVFEES